MINKSGASLADWEVIERECIAGLSFPDAERKFGVKADTIRKHARRGQWPTPYAIVRRARELAKPSRALDSAAESWNERGEKHRELAFEKTNESIKKFRIRAPANFRELEAADKVARRAAGLENAETIQQTLVQINEAGDAEQPIEATVIDAA